MAVERSQEATRESHPTIGSLQMRIRSDQVVTRCPQAGIVEPNTSTIGSRMVIGSFQMTIRSGQVVIRSYRIDDRDSLRSISDSDQDRSAFDQDPRRSQVAITSSRMHLWSTPKD